MEIGINTVREKLTVAREESELESAASIQRRFKAARVPVKTVDGRKGVWEIPSQHIEEVSSLLGHLDVTWSPKCLERLELLRKDYHSMDNLGVAEASSHLEYASRLSFELYPEQQAAAEYMVGNDVNQFALFWKMGTGKTGAMIAAANDLLSRGVIGGVLVVAERPVSMEDPWKTNLESWLDQEEVRANRVALARGNRLQRSVIYDEDPTWLVVHYAQLTPDLVGLSDWAGRMSKEEPPLVIFDESDYIKNPNSNRGRSAKLLRQSFGRCWLASGTPAPNSPLDYKHQLAVMRGYPIELALTGDMNQDAERVAATLKNDFYYLQQENPRKMPEELYDVSVELNPTQRRAYDRVAGALLTHLETMDDATFNKQRLDILNRRLALLRICCDPSHESLQEAGLPEAPDFNDPAKVIAIDNLLDDILSDSSEKVVIWSRFRNVAIQIYERYRDKWGASLFIGGEGDHRDLSRDECRVLVATLQKGSSSISLTPARNAIYESLDDMSRDFAQSMARINRTGQTRDCRYWIITSKDTLEEEVLNNTRRKLSTSQAVLDDIGTPGRALLIEQLKKGLNRPEVDLD